jgi:leucyl/phenylalanyl-tRNA--protein transferase
MPVYELSNELIFPPPELAEADGLLAVGGDLSPRRLLLAYAMGIFPWYSEDQPILWWSPDPRLILLPGELRVSRSLRQTMGRDRFTFTLDRAFPEVIDACARVHAERDGSTWITPEMRAAYIALHRMGFAHSVETWVEGELAGGLYGVALGGAFSGESMFSTVSDSSKAALVVLAGEMEARDMGLIDCQVKTPHLVSLGAREVPRHEFLDRLAHELQKPLPPGPWTDRELD